jgi:outer membrane immunogenic protein
MAPPIAYNWTGFYIGGSVGARWAVVDWQTIEDTGPGGGTPPVGPNNPASLDSTSFRVGAYAGYNWQFASEWLAGLEADIAWGRNNSSVSPFPGTPGGLFGGGPTNSDTVKLGWDGSVRGRLGYLVGPTWLVYATGGVAFQQIETISSCGTGGGYCGAGVTVSGATSTVKAGWTVGGGVEAALWSRWLARVEYRYADYGQVRNDLPPAATSGIHSEIRVRTNTALVGLAYKF